MRRELTWGYKDQSVRNLIDVLKHNSRDNVNSTPGLLEKHERFLLGDRYETVAKWEDEDEPTQNFEENNGKIFI